MKKQAEMAPKPVIEITTSTSVTLTCSAGAMTTEHLCDLIETSLRQGAPADASVTPYNSGYGAGCGISVHWSPA